MCRSPTSAKLMPECMQRMIGKAATDFQTTEQYATEKERLTAYAARGFDFTETDDRATLIGKLADILFGGKVQVDE